MSQFEDIDISGKYSSIMVTEPVPVASSPSSSRSKKLLVVSLLAAAVIMVIVLSRSQFTPTTTTVVLPVNSNDVVSVSDDVEICSVDGNMGSCIDYTTCSGTSTSGLCSGGFNIQCCVPSVSAGDSACTGRGGVCKTSGCSGSWVTGLCSGAADRRCCVSGGGGSCPSGTYSHSTAASLLSAAGISTSSSGGCSTRSRSDCTSLECIRHNTVSGLISFKKSTGCGVTITGGTETGHASGTYSHGNGYKVDISMTSCLTNYIQSKFKKLDSIHWADGSSNNYHYEGNHWDITYY